MEQQDQRIIAEYVIAEAAKEDKTVRDPIHGDILWNHLETHVIDTEAFQRLRRIRQLGTVHLVFPGAEHSRFQHSLGTMHMAQTLLEHIKHNRFSQYRTFGQDATQDLSFMMIVRLAALLHDIHEFPLSHTLEKEGNILQKQWKDKTINVLMLGKKSDIFKAIEEYILGLLNSEDTVYSYVNQNRSLGDTGTVVLNQVLLLNEKQKKDFAGRLARTIIAYSYKLLDDRKTDVASLALEIFGDNEIVEGLVDEEFLTAGSQIVVNTICADLLDYLPRDFYFCGIKKTYDERFLKYSTITDNQEPEHQASTPVFAYRLLSKRQEMKFSVLSSLFDVLELRYTLAELVHTNRTKNAFSAMVIEAFNFYYQSIQDEKAREDFSEKIMKMGDDELLSFLRKEHSVSEHILSCYFSRKPYREHILWDCQTIHSNIELYKALEDHIRNPRERYCLEQLIVDWLNLSLPEKKKLEYGDCLLYVMPDPKSLYKELETNVIYLDEERKPTVVTLFSLTEPREPYSPTHNISNAVIERTISQRTNLINKYGNLSHTSLFFSPKVDLSNVQTLTVTLIENLLRNGLNYPSVSIVGSTGLLPAEVQEKFAVLKRSKRAFTSFEEILKSLGKA